MNSAAIVKNESLLDGKKRKKDHTDKPLKGDAANPFSYKSSDSAAVPSTDQFHDKTLAQKKRVVSVPMKLSSPHYDGISNEALGKPAEKPKGFRLSDFVATHGSRRPAVLFDDDRNITHLYDKNSSSNGKKLIRNATKSRFWYTREDLNRFRNAMESAVDGDEEAASSVAWKVLTFQREFILPKGRRTPKVVRFVFDRNNVHRYCEDMSADRAYLFPTVSKSLLWCKKEDFKRFQNERETDLDYLRSAEMSSVSPIPTFHTHVQRVWSGLEAKGRKGLSINVTHQLASSMAKHLTYNCVGHERFYNGKVSKNVMIYRKTIRKRVIEHPDPTDFKALEDTTKKFSSLSYQFARIMAKSLELALKERPSQDDDDEEY